MNSYKYYETIPINFNKIDMPCKYTFAWLVSKHGSRTNLHTHINNYIFAIKKSIYLFSLSVWGAKKRKINSIEQRYKDALIYVHVKQSAKEKPIIYIQASLKIWNNVHIYKSITNKKLHTKLRAYINNYYL